LQFDQLEEVDKGYLQVKNCLVKIKANNLGPAAAESISYSSSLCTEQKLQNPTHTDRMSASTSILCGTDVNNKMM
jgi:hypothetical protein